MAITFTNTIYDDVIESLATIINDEFAISIHYDEHRGNNSFLLIPESDTLLEHLSSGISREYSITIEYQIKSGGSYNKNSFKQVSNIMERLKRLVFNNINYSCNMKIGITFSTFDLFHAGHVLMLEECKENCDYLIVGLHTDPSYNDGKEKPTQSIYERMVQLKSVKYMDEIIVYDDEEDLYNVLLSIMPDVRFLGEDYRGIEDFTGSEIEGIEIFFNSRRHSYSSTELRSRIRNE